MLTSYFTLGGNTLLSFLLNRSYDTLEVKHNRKHIRLVSGQAQKHWLHFICNEPFYVPIYCLHHNLLHIVPLSGLLLIVNLHNRFISTLSVVHPSCNYRYCVTTVWLTTSSCWLWSPYSVQIQQRYFSNISENQSGAALRRQWAEIDGLLLRNA